MAFAIVYITHEKKEDAQALAGALLDKKLIACANIFPITSAFWWQGAVQNEEEWVSIVKTRRDRWDRLREEVGRMHPFDVPCIMKIEVEANEDYERWIHESVA